MENETEIKIDQTSNEESSSKKISPLFVFVLILIFGIVAYFGISKSRKNTETPNQTSAPKTEEKVKGYTLSDVLPHSTKEDCWMVIDNKVYDVTKFIPMHKGGDQILLGCGKDATELFNNRPDEKGSHPEKAFNMLPNFQIGILSGS